MGEVGSSAESWRHPALGALTDAQEICYWPQLQPRKWKRTGAGLLPWLKEGKICSSHPVGERRDTALPTETIPGPCAGGDCGRRKGVTLLALGQLPPLLLHSLQTGTLLSLHLFPLTSLPVGLAPKEGDSARGFMQSIAKKCCPELALSHIPPAAGAQCCLWLSIESAGLLIQRAYVLISSLLCVFLPLQGCMSLRHCEWGRGQCSWQAAQWCLASHNWHADIGWKVSS